MERFVIGCIVGLCLAVGAGLARRGLASGHGAPKVLFGHLSYEVADPATLTAIGPKRDVLLRPAAAAAFQAMQAAAEADGLQLVPISGFRDMEHQRHLFFDEAAAHRETVRERARTCAPPGYSEHHTGYSLDVADAAHHATQLELTFKDTQAFVWLKRHASQYRFEMSFPPMNAQRVAYEPWHWRFVGDPPSFRTFYQAHALAHQSGMLGR